MGDIEPASVAGEERQKQPSKLSRIKVGFERVCARESGREKKPGENWHALSYRADRCIRSSVACKRVKMHRDLSRIEMHGRTTPHGTDRSAVGRFCHSFAHRAGSLAQIPICAIFFSCAPNFSFARCERGKFVASKLLSLRCLIMSKKIYFSRAGHHY